VKNTNRNQQRRTGGVAQVVEGLPGIREALGSIFSTGKKSTKAEDGWDRVQDRCHDFPVPSGYY
jgi:hypothetical protein